MKTQSSIPTVLLSIFLFIGGFFVSFVEMDPSVQWISSLSILLFCIPSYYASSRWLGNRKSFLLLFSLSAFALIIENIGVMTGFPYGGFEYGSLIGNSIGVVPWTVAFAWTPLVLGSIWMTMRTLQFMKVTHSNKSMIVFFISFTAMFLVIIDLLLDPAAVALGFWSWQVDGWYYGIPLSNYFGWMFSGAIGALIVWIIAKKKVNSLTQHPGLVSSLFYILIFWSSVAFWQKLYIPLIIGALLILTIWKFQIVGKDE